MVEVDKRQRVEDLVIGLLFEPFYALEPRFKFIIMVPFRRNIVRSGACDKITERDGAPRQRLLLGAPNWL